MNELPLISVIVPVYKAEEYLDKCIQSIVEQTYRNLEIILVDDGSPGNSGAICDAWAEKDSRIVVIHKENGGTGRARNTAIERAKGAFIAFLDCDDYISAHMYQHLYELMDDETDLAECGYQFVYDDHCAFSNLEEQVTVCTALEAMRYHIGDKILYQEEFFRQIVWNKLYRRTAIGDIRFVDGMRSDDEFFTYRIISQCRKLVHTSLCLHAYRQQPGSVMHQRYSLKNLEWIQAYHQRLEYLQAHMPSLVYEAKVVTFFHCIYAMKMTMNWMAEEERETARSRILQAASEVTPLKPSKENSLSVNFWLMAAQLSFDGVCRLQNYFDSRKK